MAESWDDLEKRIDAIVATRLAQQQEVHAKEIAELRAEVDAARKATEITLSGLSPHERVPEHAGGPGLEMAATWSLAEQTASARAADKTALEVAHEKLDERVRALEQMEELRKSVAQPVNAPSQVGFNPGNNFQFPAS